MSKFQIAWAYYFFYKIFMINFFYSKANRTEHTKEEALIVKADNLFYLMDRVKKLKQLYGFYIVPSIFKIASGFSRRREIPLCDFNAGIPGSKVKPGLIKNLKPRITRRS